MKLVSFCISKMMELIRMYFNMLILIAEKYHINCVMSPNFLICSSNNFTIPSFPSFLLHAQCRTVSRALSITLGPVEYHNKITRRTCSNSLTYFLIHRTNMILANNYIYYITLSANDVLCFQLIKSHQQ